MSLFDVLGWVGAVMILGAYGLITLGRWRSDSLSYQVTNAVGAVALLVWACSIAAWQSALINAVWVVVGVVGLWRIRARSSRPVPPPHVGD